MATDGNRLRVIDDGGVTRIEFIDRNILDEANIQQIGDEIMGIIDLIDAPKLLISFTNVDHLSSAALGTLITINNKIKAKAGQLRLADINAQIYEVFELTRLNQLFEIHKTAAEGMASFA